MEQFHNKSGLKMGPSGEGDIHNLVSTTDEINYGYENIVNARLENMSLYIDESKHLREILTRYLNGEKFLEEELKSYFLVICGITSTTIQYLSKPFTEEIINNLVDSFDGRENSDIIEELVSRFLLVRGLSFNGSVKVITGKIAEEKLKENIISVLLNASCEIYINSNGKWGEYKDSCCSYIKGISWNIDGNARTILFNFKIPSVKRNIDFVLFESSHKNICLKSPSGSKFVAVRDMFSDDYRERIDICTTSHLDAKNCLLIGEIKNVIAPHKAFLFWRESYSPLLKDKKSIEGEIGKEVHSAFVSSVMHKDMILAIYEELESGSLSYAVNLSKDDNVEKFCNWLISI